MRAMKTEWHPANVRFWVFENGDWVKLTLRPGAENALHWSRFERTDEGFHAESATWMLVDAWVHRVWETRSRDCDGRHGTEGADCCRIDRLRSVPVEDYGALPDDDGCLPPVLDEKGKPLFRPRWEESRPTKVYDQFAQMAGY